jgi:hypothetical protein
MYFKGAVNGK